MMSSDNMDEDNTKAKELFNELLPILKKHSPYEISLVCMGIIVNLVNSAPVDKREELYTDMRLMIEAGIERLGK